MEKVRECMAAGPCRFQVVVPATDPPGAMQTEARAHRDAQARLNAALARFREAGAEVTGRIGDARPMEAIRDVLLHDFSDAELDDFLAADRLTPEQEAIAQRAEDRALPPMERHGR